MHLSNALPGGAAAIRGLLAVLECSLGTPAAGPSATSGTTALPTARGYAKALGCLLLATKTAIDQPFDVWDELLPEDDGAGRTRN